MIVAVCYIYPTINRYKYDPMARRFVQTYMQHPPGSYPHQLHVLVNGPMYKGIEHQFAPLPVQFTNHTNAGRDIGAYQYAAATVPCDLMICLGAPLRFHRDGWLDWIVDSYLQNGPGLYGAWAFHHPATHIRTTAFWLPPSLLNAYPFMIADHQRYSFEHGPESITLWTQKMGYPTLQVTWKGTFTPPHWHYIGPEDSLFLDQHLGGQ